MSEPTLPVARAAADWTSDNIGWLVDGREMSVVCTGRRRVAITLSRWAMRRRVLVGLARSFDPDDPECVEAVRSYVRGELDFARRLFDAVGPVAGSDGCCGHDGP